MTDRVGNIDLNTDDDDPKPKRKGRPPGARNKKGFLKLIDKNYDKLESLLNDKQKQYLKLSFQGMADYDPLIQAEIFMLLYQLYITDVFDNAMNYTDPKTGEVRPLVTQDIAQTLGQYRMGLKDIEDMRQKRDAQKAKSSDNERMVDPTRKSTDALIAELIGEGTEG
jgi:hypothetical protein